MYTGGDFMYLRKNKGHKGRIYLSIAKNYREDGKTKTRQVRSLGYLDDLQMEFDDPIAHFKELAKQMTEEEGSAFTKLTLNLNESLSFGSQRFNLGYSILKRIYLDLDVDSFFNKKQRSLNIQYRLDEIFKLLIFSRTLYPSSKLDDFNNKDRFFEKTNFSKKDMYRSLDILDEWKEDIQTHLHTTISSKYGRDTSTSYYDCTNYYFEIDEGDGFRERGPSKEHRKTPIVQMGLLMDNDGIPVAYDLFPGNQSEKLSLTPILKRVRRKYNIDRTIVVADKGLNTSDNIFYNLGKGDGYIYSQTIKGANQEIRQYVLDQEGYIHSEDGFKIKSRIYPKTLTYHDSSGAIKKQNTDQKQIIFYSPDYDKKAKAERSKIIEKSVALINNKGAHTRATSYGAAAYVKNINFDKKTGEVIGKDLSLDLDKIKEEEKFDGYYAIVTSEITMSDSEVINQYRGLWRIEESFKVVKSTFSARPIRVSTQPHIEAHFLTCFVSLVITRLLEKELQHKYNINRIVESLRRYECSHLKDNMYVCDYRDDVLEELGKIYDMDFTKKYLTRGSIKKLLQKVK